MKVRSALASTPRRQLTFSSRSGGLRELGALDVQTPARLRD